MIVIKRICGFNTMKADCFVRRCRRRNSGLVVEKRQAQAQDLIAALRIILSLGVEPQTHARQRMGQSSEDHVRCLKLQPSMLLHRHGQHETIFCE